MFTGAQPNSRRYGSFGFTYLFNPPHPPAIKPAHARAWNIGRRSTIPGSTVKAVQRPGQLQMIHDIYLLCAAESVAAQTGSEQGLKASTWQFRTVRTPAEAAGLFSIISRGRYPNMGQQISLGAPNVRSDVESLYATRSDLKPEITHISVASYYEAPTERGIQSSDSAKTPLSWPTLSRPGFLLYLAAVGVSFQPRPHQAAPDANMSKTWQP
ncbi:uncharacterized protein MYCFIDRAFT_172721 [Pseudocercospora fijiensis CIRAD86]|uniref:Uncharacterized protein n=1 Tax=Pseudocercospora fijiensis (strain CIRAD86) TaxID=383855 RepID=M2ZB18_PSEFD|nr:uncharacterized protein MYCFIDRAFT_172721 [Pseudocercospora fijiensis CIRAD86]EME87045.1 hypothetical protein MYCFIDRAFT_172721 [Pseudocercospora fijiensis CIRAD86]